MKIIQKEVFTWSYEIDDAQKHYQTVLDSIQQEIKTLNLMIEDYKINRALWILSGRDPNRLITEKKRDIEKWETYITSGFEQVLNFLINCQSTNVYTETLRIDFPTNFNYLNRHTNYFMPILGDSFPPVSPEQLMQDFLNTVHCIYQQDFLQDCWYIKPELTKTYIQEVVPL